MAKLDEFDVSVVMGVYNEARSVLRTLESLDSQRGVNLEVIVVNDGSTDETGSLLDAHAARRDNYQIIHQSNAGLTAALMRGCEAARSSLIARQDAGDWSKPERLVNQRDQLLADQSVVLVSSATAFYDAGGHLLYLENQPEESGLMPPHHGSAMFRRTDYQRAGGYRAACFVAQDMDLWLRLAEFGRHVCLDQALYHATIYPGAISVGKRHIQQSVAECLMKAAELRRSGKSDDAIMATVARTSRQPSTTGRASRADYHYFCGSCLARRDVAASRDHFLSAWQAKPTHIRALFRYLQSFLRRPAVGN